MIELSIKEVIEASFGQLLSGTPDIKINGISTDTRTINRGDLFFALVGENYNGHQFLNEAFGKGACSAVISDEKYEIAHPYPTLIKVTDTLKALGDLAAYHRNKFQLPTVAVTGSTGKTTTKEMIAAILGEKYKVLKNQANFNNEIGVPLTIFNLNYSHQVSILEFAMRGKEQIRYLTKIAKPTHGVITNIGISHLEYLGTLDNTARAKGELLDEMNKGGIAILNRDDHYFDTLKDMAKGVVISYGIKEPADFVATKIQPTDGAIQFTLQAPEGEVRIFLPAPGYHEVYNALAASVVGLNLGLDLSALQNGFKKFKPLAMRLETVEAAGFTIINDTYNASPASAKAALDILKDMKKAQRKIAVLGDMLELGEVSREAHLQVGQLVGELGIDLLVTVGELANFIAEGAKAAGLNKLMSFPTNQEATDYLKSIIEPGDVLLIKGSRAMRMDEIVRGLAKG